MMVLSLAMLMTTATGGLEIPVFVDQTAETGLTFLHSTTHEPLFDRHMIPAGVAVGDFNRDGWLDLIAPGGTGQNTFLFINDGDGTFTDRAAEWGIDTTSREGSSVAIADINNDGYLDVHLGNVQGRGDLYLNINGAFFVEIAAAAGVVDADGFEFDVFGATFGDVDLDGDVDLVTADWDGFSPLDGNQLFVNDGAGFFERWTIESNLYQPIFLLAPFTPTVVDLNGDRWPEVPVAGDFSSSIYQANDGDGTFTRIEDNGTGTDENGMGSCFGDYDGDGDLDWFVTSIYDDDGSDGWGVTGNRLYRNDGNHQFTDVTDEAGVRNGFWGWGCSFADYNHDGLLDLSMTNGLILPWGGNLDPTFVDDPSRLWLHTGIYDGAPTYVEVSAVAGFVHTTPGKGLVSFDADNDGDLDIAISTNFHDFTYFENTSNPPPTRWIQLELISPVGIAPDGMGATIDLTVDGVTYHRAVFASSTFMGQDPYRIHFGFPETQVIPQFVVNWPDETVQVFTNITPGQIFLVRPEDVTGDGQVAINDLLQVIGAWGDCSPCIEDINRDGTVDVLDLLALLGAWD